VNIDTPFPDRPATPFWDPRGQPGLAGLGDYTLSNGQACDPGLMGPVLCQDSTQRILQAIAAGSAAASQTLGAPLITGQSSYALPCPAGLIYNPATLTCTPGVTATASANSGMILLLIAGAVLFFMSRR
jgi:hypothetical protein